MGVHQREARHRKPHFLDFYFAERRIEASRLTITTSLDLKGSDKPVDSAAVKAVEGWLYDRDGDGIADRAEVAFDKQPDHTPAAIELRLAGEAKDYIPLRPDKAEDWIRRNTGETGNPGLVVLGFTLSHPAELKLAVFDNLGHFVNRTSVTITREDLQSGKLARDPVTRAYMLRLAWFPVSHDGQSISTGAYIVRAAFAYGADPRDYVAPGTRVDASRFGFVRGQGVWGLGRH
jgi:hypothetical protein